VEEVEEIEVQKLKSSRVQEFKSSERQGFNAEDAEFAEEEKRTQDPPSNNEDGAPGKEKPKSPRATPARGAPEERGKPKSRGIDRTKGLMPLLMSMQLYAE